MAFLATMITLYHYSLITVALFFILPLSILLSFGILDKESGFFFNCDFFMACFFLKETRSNELGGEVFRSRFQGDDKVFIAFRKTAQQSHGYIIVADFCSN